MCRGCVLKNSRHVAITRRGAPGTSASMSGYTPKGFDLHQAAVSSRGKRRSGDPSPSLSWRRRRTFRTKGRALLGVLPRPVRGLRASRPWGRRRRPRNRFTPLPDSLQAAARVLMALQPADTPSVASSTAAPSAQPGSAELKDPSLRVSLEEFRKLAPGTVTIVGVRGQDGFAVGHIPGARSIPLESVETAVEQLRKLGKPVVTYFS
jgi:hypothetical protein